MNLPRALHGDRRHDIRNAHFLLVLACRDPLVLARFTHLEHGPTLVIGVQDAATGGWLA